MTYTDIPIEKDMASLTYVQNHIIAGLPITLYHFFLQLFLGRRIPINLGTQIIYTLQIDNPLLVEHSYYNTFTISLLIVVQRKAFLLFWVMEDNSHVKVLTFWASPFCMRVILALEYKGIKYEILETDKLNQSEFLQQCNPALNKAPVLIHNGRAIPESLIILEYIDETWPSQDGMDFLPKNPYDRALARFWGDFIDKKILSIVGGIVKTKGQEQEKAKVELVEEFIRLDNTLATISLGQPFFSGDHMGFIDIVVAPYMPWLRAAEQLVNLKLPDSSKCPHMNDWMDKMYEQACVSKALAQPDKLLDYAKSLRKRNFGSV